MAPMRLRITLINIQSGIGVTEGYRQYLTSGWRYLLPHTGRGVMDAGPFLKFEGADIALLTEIDGGSRRSRHLSQLERIVADSEMSHARFFSTRLVGTAINEGNAIVSRFPIIEDRVHPLASRVNPRVLGETVIEVSPEHTLTAIVAHLALGARQRELQLAQILEHVRTIKGPFVIGGDFNERDHRAFKRLERAGLVPVSVPGYPSWKPKHALQVLFLSRHFTLVHAGVPEHARFSDHLPLIVEAELT